MSLVSLPTEILQLICKFIPEVTFLYGTSEVFANLAICCRSLNTIISPQIYHRVSVGPRGMFLLLRSILEKPSLALDVRDFAIRPQRPGSDEIDLGKACTLLRRPGLLPEACTRPLRPDDGNAIALLLAEVLLLRISDVVEELSINATLIAADATLFHTKRWRQRPCGMAAPPFPNLVELTIATHYACNEERDIFEQMGDLIVMSQPQKLYIEVHHPLDYLCEPLRVPNLQELRISCEGMVSWELERMLESCPKLRVLSYYGGSGPEEDHEMFEEQMSVRDICEILKTREHQLEGLEIHHHYEDDAVTGYGDTIADLSHYTKLKDLQLNAEALGDVEPDSFIDPWERKEVAFLHKFPRSLESVRIFRADDRHVKELRSLARRKVQEFPNLKELTLEWWNGDESETPTELGTNLMAAGIKLIHA